MNPSNNNDKSKSNNPNHFNTNQNNPNFINFNQPYGNSQIMQVQEENLLDSSMDIQLNQIPTFNNGFQNFLNNNTPPNPNSIPNQNQSNFRPNIPNNFQPNPFQFNQNMFAPKTAQKKIQNFKQRLSSIDEQFFNIFKENQKKPQNIPPPINNPNPQKQEKNKKVISRLSQQFYPKSGASEQNLKSKRKSRRTVGAFGLDHIQREQQRINRFENNIPQENQPEKMELQMDNLKPKQQRNIGQSENSMLISNSMKPNSPNLEKNEFKSAEERLSQVKKNKKRLSIGIQGVISLMKNMDQQKPKKKMQPQRKSRVSLDYSQLSNFLFQKDGQQQKKSPFEQNKSKILERQKQSAFGKFQQKSKNINQGSKNNNRLSNVIQQDEKEDEGTPFKKNNQTSKPFNNQKITKLTPNQLPFSFFGLPSSKKQPRQLSPDHYTRWVFDNCFTNLDQKMKEKKQRVEQIRKKRQQLINSTKAVLSKFNIDSQKLQKWKQQQQQIRLNIDDLRARLNEKQHDNNCSIIQKFETKYCIKIHKLQKISKPHQKVSHNVSQSNLYDGFFAEFTYDDILFRIKKNQKMNQIVCKFIQRIVVKKLKLDFQLSYDQRIIFIQMFINRKLRHVKTFTEFVHHLVQYCQALKKFQLTINHYIMILNIRDLQLTESKNQIQFYLDITSKFEFLYVIDMINLTTSGGIKIYDVNQRKNLDIPQQFTVYKGQQSNKLAMCLSYADKYIAQQIQRRLKQAVKPRLVV